MLELTIWLQQTRQCGGGIATQINGINQRTKEQTHTDFLTMQKQINARKIVCSTSGVKATRHPQAKTKKEP